MRILFTSYVKASGYNDPLSWLKYLEPYTGILEALATEHEVTDIERIDYCGELKKNGVQYYFIRQQKNVVRFPLRQHNMIASQRPDVVIVNGFSFPLQLLQLRRKLGRKVIILLLHRADKPMTGVKRYLQRLADTCVDGYLFVSAAFGEQWKKNISLSKIYEVIQASSVFKPLPDGHTKRELTEKASPAYLWVGNLTINKDPLTVAKAFIRFAKEYPAARLFMIYRSEELLPELKLLLQQSNALILIGKKERDELAGWYTTADFFISGSHYEGSGIAAAEAMSCGCIPVLTDITSFKKMTGSCGLLYEPGNEEALLNTLRQTVSMDLVTEKKKVIKQFNEELSFEAIARKITRICNNLRSA